MREFVRHPRTVKSLIVPSRFLVEDRELTVYYPPGYDERLSYPVVYSQDGQDFFFLGRAATIASHLILEEDAEPFLIVGVHVDKAKRTSEYAPDGERFAAYCRFFAEELIPFVENKTAAREGSDNRILLGDSLGGTVSLHLALQYPALFRKVLLLSGALFEQTRRDVQDAGPLEGLSVQMTVGTDETAVQTEWGTIDFVQHNRLSHQLLQQKKARVSYSEQPGRHVWGFWQQALPDMLLDLL